VRQTQQIGNCGQQQCQLFSATPDSHIQREKISSLESKDEDDVQVSVVMGLVENGYNEPNSALAQPSQ